MTDDSEVRVDAAVDAGPVWSRVVLADRSAAESAVGTEGSDICGAVAKCGGPPHLAIAARLVLGWGNLCEEVGPDCSTSRTDPQAALDDGAQCEAASAPSDYVSMGDRGLLELDFGRDLRGCTLRLVELVGNAPDRFDVYVCHRPLSDPPEDDWPRHCLSEGMPLATNLDGTAEVEVPAP